MRYEKGTDKDGNEAYVDTRMGKFVSKEEYEEDIRTGDDGYDDLDGEWWRIF